MQKPRLINDDELNAFCRDTEAYLEGNPGGLVDFALGSDTLGSVRIPASHCALYGMRTTHGRIPLEGMLLQAPDYDTVGWFARDEDTFSQVGRVLLEHPGEFARPRQMLIADDAFELADKAVLEALAPHVDALASLVGESNRIRLSPAGLVEWHQQQHILQSRAAWDSVKDWIDRFNPRMSYVVAKRYVFASAITDAEVGSARVVREVVQEFPVLRAVD